MPYCTMADLLSLLPESRLIELTDDDGLGVVDQAKIDDAITAADDEINGYLAERYAVPLSPVPGLVRNLSRDLTLYNLYGRTMDEVPKVRQTRYDGAVKVLRELASGGISLGVADPPAEVSGSPQVSAGTRVFTDESLENY